MRRLGLVLVCLCACGGGSGSGDDTTPGDDGSGSDPGGNLTLRQRQAKLAMDLRGRADFMIGLGTDNTGPYDHNIPIDLHYAYLGGYGDQQSGWPNWNTGGDYPKFFSDTAIQHGVTPMFTYYMMALELENTDDAVLQDATRVHQYLSDWRLLFQKLAGENMPAAVNIEPDFFGYLMHRRDDGHAPDQIGAKIHSNDFPECASLPENVTGLTRCIVALARKEAPLVRVGFHASQWGAYFDPLDANADIEASGTAVADFLKIMGSDETDFVSVETLDRDAGFWETNGGGATCSVTGGSRGPVYWQADGDGLPNGAQHVRWVKALTKELNRPALEWQTPLGRPSTTCGGSDSHWRDNRVEYFFAHVPQLVDAGVAGMTFGVGAGGQTTVSTDGDQFKTAAAAYMASPASL
ncbi:MAG TPA: hypothetical protein VGM90_15190 [Kofleriaceae bacterium]|jgi:hypothetical protein